MDYPPARLLNPRMSSGLLAASLVVAFLGATPAAPRLGLLVARATFDPLDAIDVTVRVFNGRSTPIVIRFGQTAEYGLAISRDGGDRWNSPATTGGQPHMRTFQTGSTTLVTYEWNGVLADGTAPAPGTYTLHGALLANGSQPTTAVRIRIDAPLPVSTLAKIGTQVVTIAGTLDPIGMTLHDATGDIRLARRITGVPLGAVVDVRGWLAIQPDGTKAFAIERWAPQAVTSTTPN
jgi:hypothetical protein